MTLRRILVPVDFSQSADAARAMASAMARCHGAAVTLVHVDDAPYPGARHLGGSIAPERYSERDERSLNLDDRVTELARAMERIDGIDARGAVVRMPVVEGILQAARQWHPDVIVVGSRSADDEDRLAFGTVATRVSRQAPCPVLVTRAGGEHAVPKTGGFRHPVVGIDYSALSAASARAAIQLAERDAVVDLLHVWHPLVPDDDISPGLERPDTDTLIEEGRARELARLDEFADAAESPQVALECHVEVGRPAHQLLEHLERRGNDLAVVGAHGRATPEQVAVGTVAERVLHHAPVPVLLVPTTARRHSR